jgi:hypothetical protein
MLGTPVAGPVAAAGSQTQHGIHAQDGYSGCGSMLAISPLASISIVQMIDLEA